MRRETFSDVFVCGIPKEVDTTDPMHNVTLLAHLEKLARDWVWRQWGPGEARPIDIEFHVTDWLITDEIDKVDEFQPAHDCAACLAGNDQAKAYLREHPGRWLAMANMTYTEVWRRELHENPEPH